MQSTNHIEIGLLPKQLKSLVLKDQNSLTTTVDDPVLNCINKNDVKKLKETLDTLLAQTEDLKSSNVSLGSSNPPKKFGTFPQFNSNFHCLSRPKLINNANPISVSPTASKKSFNINQTFGGETYLMIAAQKGNFDIVNILIRAKAKINITDNYGLNALMKAAIKGHGKILELLIEQSLIEHQQKTIQRKRSVAISQNKIDNHDSIQEQPPQPVKLKYKELLSTGKIPELLQQRTFEGEDLLLLAAKNNQDHIVSILLYKQLFNPHHSDKKGNTVLKWAQNLQKISIIEFIKTHYVDVNAVRIDPPLKKPSLLNKIDSVQTQNSNTLLENVAEKKLETIKMDFQKCETTRESLIVNAQKRNILILAAYFNRMDIMNLIFNEYLTIFKEHLDDYDYRGMTALSWAAFRGNELMVKLLLNAGASAFIPDFHGNTTLKYGLRSRNLPTIRILRAEYQTKFFDLKAHQFIKNCRLIKWIGHGLGLDAEIRIPDRNNEMISVPASGSVNLINEYNLLHYLLTKYIDNENQLINVPRVDLHSIRYFEIISQSLKTTINYLQCKENVTVETLVAQYPHQVTIIPVGSNSHDFSLVLYKHWIIICNRGQGRSKFGYGSCIFLLRNKDTITPHFIESLYVKLGEELTTDQIYEKLLNDNSGIINKDDPQMVFDTKTQKFNTCSYANLKVTIEAIIYVLHLEELLIQKNIPTNTSVTNFTKDQLSICTDASSYAETVYKKGFSSWSRDHLVEFFCEKAKLACTNKNVNVEVKPINKDMKHKDKDHKQQMILKQPKPNDGLYRQNDHSDNNKGLFFSLASAILIEHHGQDRVDLKYDRTEKKKQELERAKQICLTMYGIDKVESQKMAKNLINSGCNSEELLSILNP